MTEHVNHPAHYGGEENTYEKNMFQMKEQIQKLSKLILPMSLIANIGLIYELNKFPERILTAMNLPVKDTLVVTKTITAQLQTTNNFVYFQGIIKKDAIRWSDNYEYKIQIPAEIYEGYLTEVNDNNGGEYFLWSRNRIFKTELNTQIKGWFVNGTSAIQNNDGKYLQVLYPIVDKRNSDLK